MKKYKLICYNNKEKEVYRIWCVLDENKFNHQIKRGYLRFCNENGKCETIVFLNMYNRVDIYEE